MKRSEKVLSLAMVACLLTAMCLMEPARAQTDIIPDGEFRQLPPVSSYPAREEHAGATVVHIRSGETRGGWTAVGGDLSVLYWKKQSFNPVGRSIELVNAGSAVTTLTTLPKHAYRVAIGASPDSEGDKDPKMFTTAGDIRSGPLSMPPNGDITWVFMAAQSQTRLSLSRVDSRGTGPLIYYVRVTDLDAGR